MKSRHEIICGWLALAAWIAVPIILLVLLVAQRNIVRGEQITLDRARLSLLVALEDYQAADGKFAPKLYGYFMVFPATNRVTLDGTNYLGVLTARLGHQFGGRATLNITTNKVYFLLDDKQAAKIIPNNYRVSRWRIGY